MAHEDTAAQDEDEQNDGDKRCAEFVDIWASAAARALARRHPDAQVYPSGLFAGRGADGEADETAIGPEGASNAYSGDSE